MHALCSNAPPRKAGGRVYLLYFCFCFFLPVLSGQLASEPCIVKCMSVAVYLWCLCLIEASMANVHILLTLYTFSNTSQLGVYGSYHNKGVK